MIEVLKTGLLTSIQDQGRFGHRAYGVPVSGSMDQYSSRFVNLILGNSEESAVMEMTLKGPSLRFDASAVIAISGSEMSATVNGIPIQNNYPVVVNPKDILTFGYAKRGVRTYLGIKGGFKTPFVLDSRSYFYGITERYKLSEGEKLIFSSSNGMPSGLNASLKYDETVLSSNILEATKGPEFHLLSSEQKDELCTTDFVISNLNNRMAYQLESLVLNNLDNIITGPVLPGTVQLTPSGKIIVLMRDAQTTGGYPRIFQLNEKSINIMSQKSAGRRIKFRLKD